MGLLIVLATIPGIVLLVRGRGRRYADQTIAGSGLAGVGLGALFWLISPRLGPGIATLSAVLALVGLLVILATMWPRPTPALARGVVLCGTGIISLALVDAILRPIARIGVGSLPIVIGTVFGVFIVSAGGIAWRQAAAGLAAPPPVASTGRFWCVLAGVGLVAIPVAGLLGRDVERGWGMSGLIGWYPFHTEVYDLDSLNWLITAGTLPGIMLLVSGRGRTHVDQTIAGCGLVALALSTLLFAGPSHEALPLYISLVVVVVGLLTLFIPIYRGPTRALGRGCVLCGLGILALTALDWPAPNGSFEIQLVAAAGVGVTLAVGGLVAGQLARRNAGFIHQTPADADRSASI